ncbi:MAG: flagellar FlbD family protein [Planctomycetota bacterium]|jgi:flagellar protein FlbD
MIRLTRLGGTPFLLNCELIKTVERTPDTLVTLVHGERMIVQETPDEIVERVVEHGRLLRAFATA